MTKPARILILLIIVGLVGFGLWFLLIGRPGASLQLPDDQSAQQTAQPIIRGKVAQVTPLAGGYLLINKNTRAVQYLNSNGAVTDLSPKFNLGPQSELPEGEEVLNAVMDVLPLKDGSAAVVTKYFAFIVKGPDAITELPLTALRVNYNSVAYDSSTHSLLVLAAYSNTVYRYDLSNPTADATVAYESKLELNRIAAGGGQLLAYYDNLPNLEPGTVAAYSQKRQVTPQLVDLKTKAVKSLDDFKGTTYASFSGTGNYLALKKKLSTDFAVYTVPTGNVKNIPGADTGGTAWQNDILFFGRANSVWTFDTHTSNFRKAAELEAPITGITVATTGTVFTTNSNVTSLLGNTARQAINFPDLPGAPHNIYANSGHEH